MKNNALPNRRQILKSGLLTAGFLSMGGLGWAMRPGSTLPAGSLPLDLADLKYPFTLPDLSYAYDALAPSIDARTMEIHHSKHHAGYVRKLNAALESEPSMQSKSLQELLVEIDSVPESIRTAVRRNGGGHANHALYWSTMSPSGSAPEGALKSAIMKDFGSLEGLESALKTAAGQRFGSGWAWLVLNGSGQLEVTSTANQDNPSMFGQTPLFGIDVWEHAYYLNYQNRRGDYVAAFLELADWKAVSAIYDGLIG